MPITTASSNFDKYHYIKALLRNSKPTDLEDMQLQAKLNRSMDKLLSLKINKVGPFIPKADLSYNEYLAIAHDFISTDFKEETSTSTQVVIAHFTLVVLKKLLHRARLL